MPSSSRNKKRRSSSEPPQDNDDDNDHDNNHDDNDHESPRSPKQRRLSREAENDENNANMADVDNNDDDPMQQEEEEQDDEDNNNDTTTTATRTHTLATTNGSPRRSLNAPGRLAEAGVISQVYVENFMCHRKLRVDLCQNVNFIHGQNGSGKSAILAAIQICLGAGARRTHRARNLKELIRKETATGIAPTMARVQVKLLNRGDDGYKPELYGNYIIVERTISSKGGGGGYNGYKLLDEKYVEKSRSKRDLDEMLDMLNIQVENPVAVLDQEEAKKFLTGKAQDKYSFFLKATELERINRVYGSTVDSVEEMEELTYKLKQGYQIALDKAKQLKKVYEQHQQLSKLEVKVTEFQSKMGWACYQEKDGERQSAQDKLDQFLAKAAKKQAELTQAEEEEAALASQPGGQDAQGQARTARIQDLTTEATEQANKKRDYEAQLKELQGPYKAQNRDLKRLQRDLQSTVQQVEAAKQRLQQAREERLAAAGSAASEEAQRTAALQEAEQEIASRRDEVHALKQAVSNALRSYEELEPQVHEARTAVQKKERQLGGARSTLQELESSSSNNNSMAIFGPRASRVHSMVEKAKRQGKFSGPVAGPIGAYIKVAPGKEHFAELAESTLGHGMLDRFIVTNDADRRLLQDIRKQCQCQADCGVLQQNTAARYNIPPPPDVEGIETVASVLSIQDDLVFNALVDNARIDQSGLATDKESSEEKLLFRGANGKLQIRGGTLRQVYFLPKGDFWSVKNGSKTTISNEKKFRKTISTDKSAMIEQARREVADIKAELTTIRQDEGRLEGQHSQLQKEWKQSKRAMRDNDAAITKLTDRIDQIHSDMETAANTTIDLSEYEEEVAQHEEQRVAFEEQQAQLEQDLAAKKPEIDTLKTRLDEVTIRNQKIMKDLEQAEEEMTQFLDTQSQKKDALDRKREKVRKYKEVIEAHQGKVDALTEEALKALYKARQLHFTYETLSKKQTENQAGGGDPNQEGGVGDEENQQSSTSQGDGYVPTDADLEAIEPQQVDKDAHYYESKANRAKAKLEKERERRDVADEDEAESYENYMNARREALVQKKTLSQLEDQIAETRADVNERRKLWLAFRKHLQSKMGNKFGQLLGMNKYRGEVTFDNEEDTLDLHVEKENAHSNGKGQSKDLKALSGGERSYTTICLLLAFGEALETPFRVLDEFDVFLDPQVRKLTIKQLIHVAKEMKHRQFIFITPQDLSGIKADPMLKILKLTAPQRHDTAGGLSQQTLNFSQA